MTISGVLMSAMNPEVLAEIQSFEDAADYGNPRYIELLLEHYDVDHVWGIPADEWSLPTAQMAATSLCMMTRYLYLQGLLSFFRDVDSGHP